MLMVPAAKAASTVTPSILPTFKHVYLLSICLRCTTQNSVVTTRPVHCSMYALTKSFFIPSLLYQGVERTAALSQIHDFTSFVVSSSSCLLYTSPSPRD